MFANLSAKPDGMRGGSGDWVGGDDMGGDKDEILPVRLLPLSLSARARKLIREFVCESRHTK